MEVKMSQPIRDKGGHLYVWINTKKYIEDHCSQRIKLPLFQRLALTRDVFYKDGWRCDVTLEAEANHVVSISFKKFDIGRSKLKVCKDVLRIYDGDSIKSSEMTSAKGLCGQLIPKQFVSSTKTMTLKFKSRYLTASAGFTVEVTSFGVFKENSDSGACPNNSFRCMDTFCLDRSLVCDGVPNCRDKSDESAQLAGCQGFNAGLIDLSVGARVGIFVAVALLLIGMCWTIVYCFCGSSSAKTVYVPYKKI
ncbi:enteropeptidase-like isoform X2 [Mizuhopecten yessoensis]|uniref:enteropeptidase-like isoform X2 n=1 Tax=Mizuhopecten yessoensis TaxID=6573 RepID=UPI000B459428|nr:enteropeptidase-like isoform X2 [Mizuhopecten yessoensis]